MNRGERLIIGAENAWRRILPGLEWMRSRRWVRIAVNAALLGVLALVIGRSIWEGWSELRQFKLRIDFSDLGLMLAFFSANHFLLLYGWHLAIGLFGGSRDTGQNALIYSYTHIYKFLPTPAWFIGSRLHLYSQTGMRKRMVLGATAFETLAHMLTGLVLLLILQIEPSQPRTWLWSLAAVPLALAVVWFPKAAAKLPAETAAGLRLSRKAFALLLGIDLATWAIAGPFFYYLIRSLGLAVEAPIVELTRMWIIASLIAYLGTYTLGGVGVLREFSLALLLGKFISPPLALLVTVFVRLVVTAGGLVLSLLTAGYLKIQQRLKSAEETV